MLGRAATEVEHVADLLLGLLVELLLAILKHLDDCDIELDLHKLDELRLLFV